MSTTPPPFRRSTAAPRDAARTRRQLLHKAFAHVHEAGFQGTDLDTILDGSGVTKGALYHHFAGKDALGHAIVDDVVAPITRDTWVRPLADAADPIDALIAIVESTSLDAEDVRRGCPLNNLSQELSPLDEAFRTKLAAIFGEWRHAIASALRRGRARGVVRADVDPAETATFIVAVYEGYISLAKSAQDARLLQSGKKQIVKYLKSLRASQAADHDART
jgi:AcrR family transcriptional regulator